MRPWIMLVMPLLLSACATKAPVAEAVLKPTKGNAASGIVRFQQQGESLKIQAVLTGLPPGAHGFHIHERSDCNIGDGSNPGAHFNPHRARHGDPAKRDHHAGDLPMLVANASGVAKFEAMLDTVTLKPGTTNILHRSIMVHARADDYTTQPNGGDGPSLGCGMILPKE